MLAWRLVPESVWFEPESSVFKDTSHVLFIVILNYQQLESSTRHCVIRNLTGFPGLLWSWQFIGIKKYITHLQIFVFKALIATPLVEPHIPRSDTSQALFSSFTDEEIDEDKLLSQGHTRKTRLRTRTARLLKYSEFFYCTILPLQ